MGGINYPATNLARNGMQYISLRVSKKTVVKERDSRPTRMITFPSLPSLLLLCHTPCECTENPPRKMGSPGDGGCLGTSLWPHTSNDATYLHVPLVARKPVSPNDFQTTTVT